MSLREHIEAAAAALPDGASILLPVAALREWLAEDPAPVTRAVGLAEPSGWREKLWTVPADTRLGVRELAEALDRSPDWCYRAVSRKAAAERGRDPLPCSKLDGALTFEAASVRQWITASERIVNGIPRREACGTNTTNGKRASPQRPTR